MRGPAFHRIPLSVLILVPLLGMLLQGGAVAPAQAAKAKVRISYAVIAVPKIEWLCVGEAVEFSVSISRHTTVNGQRYPQWVTGGDVLGVIGNEHVGAFEPADAGRSVGAEPEHAATFLFRGEAPGRTDIEFIIRNTGEDLRVGTGFPTQSDTVSVEVTDCFDAYTSGLGTVFDTKDMGDLTEPFFLAGHLATSGVAGLTQFMFFIPNAQNRTTGRYEFVDNAWALAAPAARCSAYISGRYDVALYGNPSEPVEGDLLMKGTGVAFCGGRAIPIDYTSAPGFQIAFRPRPAPH